MPTQVFDDFDESNLGYDLDLSETGDFIVSDNRDIKLLGGIDNVAQAVKRRLTTPRGNISYFCRDVEGLLSVDTEYGNRAFIYLSEPLNAPTMTGVRDAVKACLADETRISNVEVTTGLVQVGENIVLGVEINYEIVSGGSDTIRLIRKESGFEEV